MNDILPPETNALAVINEKNVVQFFAEKGLDPVLEKIREEVASFKPDMTTETGRAAIASFAFKIAKMKNRMDDLGKQLVSGIKQQAKVIDAERSRAWDVIEALQHQVRKPLTEWEEKEKQRVANHKSTLDSISGSLALPINVSIAEIESRLVALSTFVGKDFEEFSDLTNQTLNNAIEQLTFKLDAMKKAEADRLELVRLQQAEEDRKRKEREEEIARDAAAKAKKEAEDKAETDRIAAEKKAKDEADASANREAAEKARADKAEADKAAAIEQARIEKEAAVAAERKRADDEKKKSDDEAAAREKDKKHKAKINNEALAALSAITGAEASAKKIIEAIAKSQIPHVKITY